MNSTSDTKNHFNKILISRFVSGVGDWGGLIAISNLTYNSTHSVKSLSIIYAAKICSILFSSLIQTYIFKKLNQKFSVGKLLTFLELLSAFSLIAILSMQLFDTLTLALLYFVSSICSSIFMSVTNTLISEMYPKEFKDKLRLVLYSKRAAFLIGPIVMGAIIGFFGNRFGIIADVVSFLLSGIALYNVSYPLRDLVKKDEVVSEENELLEYQKPIVLIVLAIGIVSLVGIAGGAVNSIELPYIVTKLKLGSSFFGISLALGGLGSILGLVFDRKISNDYPVSKLIFMTIGGLIISFIPWYFKSVFLFGAALVLFGISITIFSNRTLFYLVDCYNGSSKVREFFKNKPRLFLFYHQIDSLTMIVGAIVSGFVADTFSTDVSVHLIVSALILSVILNYLFVVILRKEIAS